MDADKLMDAIGMVDDRYLAEEKIFAFAPLRRKLIVLVAAVLAVGLTVVSAMAVGQELPQLREGAQQMLIKILGIETHETPPTQGQSPAAPTDPDGTEPSPPMLQQIDVVDIDGMVYAHYFKGEGAIQVFENGFYTYSKPESNEPPEQFAFWEFRKEGVVEVDGKRLELAFTHDEREFHICFDHAVIQGKLCIMQWPDGDHCCDDWAVFAIGSRTDVVMMSVPKSLHKYVSHDYFLLNLQTMETTPLLENMITDEMIADWCHLTDDLNYAMLTGINVNERITTDWLCDLRQGTMTKMDDLTGFITPSSYFLDDSTLICEQWLGDGRISIVRLDIPTGEKTVVVENVPRASAKGGYSKLGKAFGVLYAEDGAAELIDLRTGKVTELNGLDLNTTYEYQSPGGSYILLAYAQQAKDNITGKCYPKLGLLDPEKQEMKLLSRDISGNAEYLRGWLDDRTVVITAPNPDGSYYVLVYEFTQ